MEVKVMLWILVLSILSALTSGQLVSVVVDPSELVGAPGEDFVFTCKSINPGGEPLTLKWKWENGTASEDIITKGPFVVEVENTVSEGKATSQLTIKDATVSLSGKYTCDGIDSDGSSRGTSHGDLRVREAPNLKIIGNKIVESEGEVQLACMVDATGGSLSWLYEGDSISGNIDVDKDGTDDIIYDPETKNLTIIGTAALGVYTCRYDISSGGVADSFEDSVVVGEQVSIAAELSVKFTEGERGHIECKVSGRPLGNITWYDGSGREISENNKYTLEEREVEGVRHYNLYIKGITQEDRQNFTCLSENGASSAEKVILLRVRSKLAALWPFLGICGEVVVLILIILIHEKCSKGEDFGEADEDEDEAMLVNKSEQNTTNRGNKDKRKRGSNN